MFSQWGHTLKKLKYDEMKPELLAKMNKVLIMLTPSGLTMRGLPGAAPQARGGPQFPVANRLPLTTSPAG